MVNYTGNGSSFWEYSSKVAGKKINDRRQKTEEGEDCLSVLKWAGKRKQWQPYTTPTRNLTTRQLSVTREEKERDEGKLFAAIKTSRVGASASAKPRFPQKKKENIFSSLSDLRWYSLAADVAAAAAVQYSPSRQRKRVKVKGKAKEKKKSAKIERKRVPRTLVDRV